ncbi:DUF397 domain-containing protein [Cryptosporangium japonicum]|uniref:DUF397 domain-containing protein n=1 Tax=Cryptosporangium japonicum TaxID=80872 RepID=A0ABN0TMJ1_9ACTN
MHAPLSSRPLVSSPAPGGWQRSSYCVDGDCVEVRTGSVVLIRDSKAADGRHLALTRRQFRDFVAFVRRLPG